MPPPFFSPSTPPAAPAMRFRPAAVLVVLAAAGKGAEATTATAAPPARDYATTQEGSLTVRGGLPPRAGDVPAGAAMPPVPPRPPVLAAAEPVTTTTTTTTTAPGEGPVDALPAAPADMGGTAPPSLPPVELPVPGPEPTPALAAAPVTTTTTTVTAAAPGPAAGVLVAGAVRPQTATGAFTGGRGGCETLAATTLARESALDFTTPPAELLALGNMHLGLARCARGAGDAALARVRARRAAVVLARADALEIATGNLEGLADTRSQLAHAAYEAGEYDEARRLLRDAIARYSSLGRTADASRDLRLLAALGPGPAGS